MRQTISLVILIALAGCDGHVRSLYLQTPEAEKPVWTWDYSIITIAPRDDVRTVVGHVASKLSMQSRASDEWYSDITEKGYHGWLKMTLRAKSNGAWEIALVDFPIDSRSEKSRELENDLRAALGV